MPEQNDSAATFHSNLMDYAARPFLHCLVGTLLRDSRYGYLPVFSMEYWFRLGWSGVDAVLRAFRISHRRNSAPKRAVRPIISARSTPADVFAFCRFIISGSPPILCWSRPEVRYYARASETWKASISRFYSHFLFLQNFGDWLFKPALLFLVCGHPGRSPSRSSFIWRRR